MNMDKSSLIASNSHQLRLWPFVFTAAKI